MRSPFPGMDPYLERPDRWGGVHAGLIAVMREILSRQVAPRFFVDSEDGVYVLGLDDPARALSVATSIPVRSRKRGPRSMSPATCARARRARVSAAAVAGRVGIGWSLPGKDRSRRDDSRSSLVRTLMVQ